MQTKETRWHNDIQKIIRGIAILICFIASITLKKGDIFIKFQSRQSRLDDYLHEHIFRFFLEKVNLYAAKATFFLMIVTMLILILAFIFDTYQSDMGYKLHITGMATATISGILFLLVHICIGYGIPVINLATIVFMVVITIGIILTIHNFIFYYKRKQEFNKEQVSTTIAIFAIIAGCFVGYGAYLAKNLHSDYKICHQQASYLKDHQKDINQDAAYQIGNIVKFGAIYLDGYIYCATGENLYTIASDGNVTILYTLPEDGVFSSAKIFHHNGYLYVNCGSFTENYNRSIIQISLTDKTAKEIYSWNGNNMYFSVADGKLLYEIQTEYSSDVYCLDLDKSYDIADATLYDKDINSLYLDREIWTQKYVYTYLDEVYWLPDDIQFIGENGYYIYDLVAEEQGYTYKAPDKYSYNANCTLIMVDGYDGSDYIVEGVVDFNIFNNTIYYTSETETGYDIFSCDKDGKNVSYITSIPVDFIYEKYGGYYTDILMGEGFMICTVSATHDDYHRYFINLKTGQTKEITFP